MRIIINESQLSTVLTQMSQGVKNADGNLKHNPRAMQIDTAVDSLEKLLLTNGSRMINIMNGKEYVTYELYSLANTIGKRYCICKLIKDGEPYGTLYVRPLVMFKPKN
jgi:hypothetical protein